MGHNGIDIVASSLPIGTDTENLQGLDERRKVYAPVSGRIDWWDTTYYTMGIRDIPGYPDLEVQITHVFQAFEGRQFFSQGQSITQGQFLSYYAKIGSTTYPHLHITFKQYGPGYSKPFKFLDPAPSLP
jgi:hypothetical protein